MAFFSGTTQKVALSTTGIVGMGNWKISGITVEQLDSTAFGDTAKTFLTGLVDYGTVSFSGLFDIADTAGQSGLMSAFQANSKIPNLRFYANSVSYWVPNVAGDAEAGILITSCTIGADKGGLATIEFTGKCTGPMVFN
jgi:hypothetical protein